MAIDDGLLSGENAGFLDQQYVAWLADPASVDARWRDLFATWDRPAENPAAPVFQPRSIFAGASTPPKVANTAEFASAHRQAKVAQMINAYRVRGHIVADIDPLGLLDHGRADELDPAFFDLVEADMDQPVHRGPLFGEPDNTTPRRVLARLKAAYCGRIGIEYMNIHDITQRRWVQERVETLADHPQLDRDVAMRLLRRVSDGQNFEHMLQQRFPGTKRFSLEGGETLIPLLEMALDEAGNRGVREVVVGMSHRGRLNVLANILDKPMNLIVGEFQDQMSDAFQGSGDVKYHLGYSSDHTTTSGHVMHVTLTPNPSHLEIVDAVVEGRVRAKQDRAGDVEGKLAMPILLHGDAAFIGQGLVAEVLNLSGLPGYRTGGTLHIIVNNQVGFTTSPKDARSGSYASDIARMLAIPIFHVNGEDLEAVAGVVKIAVEWRQTFGRDVVIDMYCYRKYGHNEGDEPSFTQPLMYDVIRTRPNPREIVAKRLVERKYIAEADVQRINEESIKAIDEESTHGTEPPPYTSPHKQMWKQYARSSAEVDTAVPMDRLRPLLDRANTVPEGFAAHPKIIRLLEQRRQMISGDKPIDWAIGEQAAYASLVADGYRVRLSGQDSGRGTFSHRHAVLTDIRTNAEFVPLQHVADGQAKFDVFDSPLSEAGVLGFEYGYSWDYPDALVLWEAQFGDFVNGAQVVLDQFMVAGEQKWNRASGLVLLLPHGYEGQGPEHSSARVERFLQLCGEENIQVANCSTPANFFHLLRRQVLRHVRKPLVVLTPKSLLRATNSTIDELANGRFEHVIGEVDPLDAAAIRRVVLCSGKVYYDLLKARRERSETRVALVRVEMMYPLPEERIREVLASYPADAEVVWCQEEPRNQGAWPMFDEWLGHALPDRDLRYVGRKAAASPATGSHHKHDDEVLALLRDALTL